MGWEISVTHSVCIVTMSALATSFYPLFVLNMYLLTDFFPVSAAAAAAGASVAAAAGFCSFLDCFFSA
jgi:hypothetical protein